jgi:cupin 2 domain-containing protein
VEPLLSGTHWRLERIHSCLASSPEGFWYDQSEHEWVLVLRGSARLRFEDETDARDLCVGDSLLIAPHRRHRLLATDPDPGTLWLALFWRSDG